MCFNEENISEYSVRELRKNIAYLSKKYQIFEGAVLQNLLYGNENADVKEVKMTLEKASIYGEIDLEKKENTAGINLSGDQW